MVSKKLDDNHLYLQLRLKLCEQILKGVYGDGTLLPPERELAQQFGVSRVTVRKTLEMIANEGFITRVQGSGTRVSLRTSSYPGTMDIVALVAPAQNSFFASFVEYFEAIAEANDSLVLFKQAHAFGTDKISEYLFRLYQKNIRDVMLWLPDEMIAEHYLQRLRGLGMNLVLFDAIRTTVYADCVSVDNFHAIQSLYNFVITKNCRDVMFIGWDNPALSSAGEREKAFCDVAGGAQRLLRIVWREKAALGEALAALVAKLTVQAKMPECFLCGDGEIGITLKKVLNGRALPVLVVCVDDLPEAHELQLTVYAQPLKKLARQAYECLRRQNRGASAWKASNYYLPGQLIVRQN
jgi:DNA-binding LacI/PurR family transcriptional regulator